MDVRNAPPRSCWSSTPAGSAVELQILKHLKRSPKSTVSVIDEYCSAYNDLFSDVRNYECFKYLHQGIISPTKRKSLPQRL